MAVPVLSNDSAVKYFDLNFPGGRLDREDIGVHVRGLDPNYVQARCASSPLKTNAVFDLGERTYPAGTDVGQTTRVASPETMQELRRSGRSRQAQGESCEEAARGPERRQGVLPRLCKELRNGHGKGRLPVCALGQEEGRLDRSRRRQDDRHPGQGARPERSLPDHQVHGQGKRRVRLRLCEGPGEIAPRTRIGKGGGPGGRPSSRSGCPTASPVSFHRARR